MIFRFELYVVILSAFDVVRDLFEVLLVVAEDQLDKIDHLVPRVWVHAQELMQDALLAFVVIQRVCWLLTRFKRLLILCKHFDQIFLHFLHVFLRSSVDLLNDFLMHAHMLSLVDGRHVLFGELVILVDFIEWQFAHIIPNKV